MDNKKRTKAGVADSLFRGGRRLAKNQSRASRQEQPARADRKRPANKQAAILPRVWEKLRAAAARWLESDGEKSPFVSGYQTAVAKMRRARRRWRHIVREKRAHRFPESERAPIQLLLFGWSVMPLLASRARERVQDRRKRLFHRDGRLRMWLDGRRGHPAVFLGAACAIAVVALFFSYYTFGTVVTYNGREVAAVGSKAAAEDARQELEQVTARTLGQTFTIDDESIQYSAGLLPRQEVVDGETFEEDLSQEIGLVTEAYCLYVDGELIGATPYEGALEELLEQLKASAMTENTISCEFAEKIEIKQEYVSSDQVMNLGYLAETLYSTKVGEVTYTVKQGDTWSEIANSHGLTSAELLALNPGYNIDKLQIGEVLTLSASVPYLTMTVVEQEHYVEDVMYDIEYTDSAYLYKGD